MKIGAFVFVTKSPPASVLLKKAAKIKSGSKMPQKDKVGKDSQADIKKIAEIKLPDLNGMDLESACSQIVGNSSKYGLGGFRFMKKNSKRMKDIYERFRCT